MLYVWDEDEGRKVHIDNVCSLHTSSQVCMNACVWGTCMSCMSCFSAAAMSRMLPSDKSHSNKHRWAEVFVES